MQVEIWHIYGNRFHFGRHGMGQERTSPHFPSDSLFAALVARLVATQGEDEAKAFGKRFLGKLPPFVLSSAYPRMGKILFFPLPLTSIKPKAGYETLKPKKLKRVRYVSEGIFRHLLNGSLLAEEWESSEKYHGETVLMTPSEAAQLPSDLKDGVEPMWKIIRRPRVTIDRAVNSSTIFHTGQVVFNDECGLWFGLNWLNPDQDLKDQLTGLFEELGDAGLGGERSSGFGICKIIRESSIDLTGAANRPWVTLSRYIPQEDEIPALLDKTAAYKIESVEGWVQSSYGIEDQRRKTAHVFTEGSVFGSLDVDAPGCMIDVQPSYEGKTPLKHPVWRNGIALGVGLELGG